MLEYPNDLLVVQKWNESKTQINVLFTEHMEHLEYSNKKKNDNIFLAFFLIVGIFKQFGKEYHIIASGGPFNIVL